MKMAARETTNSSQQKISTEKRVFLSLLFDFSWRMVAAMLVPLFIGIEIDDHTSSDQTWANIGFLVGIVAMIVVMFLMVRRISKGAAK